MTGSGEALLRLRSLGVRVIFVTNNASKTQASVVASVRRLTGYDGSEADVVTSGLVTAIALEGRAERVFIVGAPALVETFESRGFEVTPDWRSADAVAVGMDWELTYDKLASAALAIRNGALFYATNADATFPSAEGQKPGGGAIVAALVTATGVEPVVCGKPHAPTGDMVAALVGGAEGIVTVGDRIDTDIALGKAQGWKTALVLTGVTSEAEAESAAVRPDLVVPSLEALVDLIEAAQAR